MENFVTAEQVIDEFLGDTYDEGGILKEKAYRWLFRVWKQITQDFIKTPQRVILPVSPLTRTVRLPADYVEWINIGYIDCGNIRHLKINPNLAPITVSDERLCPRCKQIDLCNVVFETITEPVVLNNVSYIKKRTRQIDSNGIYTDEITQPIWVDDDLVWETKVTPVCTLEKSSCGCIHATNKNIAQLLNCGCSADLCCCSTKDLPFSLSSSCMGSVNIFETEGFIQVSPDSNLESIYLVYNSNALRKDGISMFPESVEEALIAGVYFRSIEKKKNIPVVSKREAERAYNKQLSFLQRREMRQPMQEWMQIFNRKPRL